MLLLYNHHYFFLPSYYNLWPLNVEKHGVKYIQEFCIEMNPGKVHLDFKNIGWKQRDSSYKVCGILRRRSLSYSLIKVSILQMSFPLGFHPPKASVFGNETQYSTLY